MSDSPLFPELRAASQEFEAQAERLETKLYIDATLGEGASKTVDPRFRTNRGWYAVGLRPVRTPDHRVILTHYALGDEHAVKILRGEISYEAAEAQELLARKRQKRETDLANNR